MEEAEAEYLCDRIALMDSGRLAALGSPDELRAHVGEGKIIETLKEGVQVDEPSRSRMELRQEGELSSGCGFPLGTFLIAIAGRLEMRRRL